MRGIVAFFLIISKINNHKDKGLRINGDRINDYGYS